MDDKEFRASLQTIPPEVWEKSVNQLVEIGITALPQELKDAAVPGSYLHNTLKATAAMILGAGMAQSRALSEQLENYQEKPRVLQSKMDALKERLKRKPS